MLQDSRCLPACRATIDSWRRVWHDAASAVDSSFTFKVLLVR